MYMLDTGGRHIIGVEWGHANDIPLILIYMMLIWAWPPRTGCPTAVMRPTPSNMILTLESKMREYIL